MRRAALALAILLATAPALAGEPEDARARNAVRVLTESLAIPESAIPDKLFDEARAIVIVPDTIKAGLIFGGRRGLGLMSVKRPDNTWSSPAYVKLVGGSIGFQAGVQSADVVLVFRSDRGVADIVNGKFTLGADAGVAAGPVGRNAATATDGQFKAEIWSWSRARGLFAGIALDGAVLKIDDEANQAVYGNGATPRMIFEGRAPQTGGAEVVALTNALEEATATARARRSDGEVAPAPVVKASATTTVAAPVAPVSPAATTKSEEEVKTTPLP